MEKIKQHQADWQRPGPKVPVTHCHLLWCLLVCLHKAQNPQVGPMWTEGGWASEKPANMAQREGENPPGPQCVQGVPRFFSISHTLVPQNIPAR